MCSISTNLLFIGANFATYAYAIVKKSTMQVKEKDAFMLFFFQFSDHLFSECLL